MSPNAAAPPRPERPHERSWRTVAVLLFGAVAATALGIGAIAHIPMTADFSSSTRVTQLVRLLRPRLGPVLLGGGLLGLALAWLALRRVRLTPRVLVAALVLWNLPLLLLPPAFSGDLYAYGDHGYALSIGQNPYHVGLGRNDGPFAVFHQRGMWADATTLYGPVALRLSQLAFLFGGGGQYGTLLALKVVASTALVVGWFGLRSLARSLGRDPDVTVWLGLLNPVIGIHVVSAGHNDAMVAVFVVVALWSAHRGGRLGLLLGAVALAMAISVKPTPIVLVPAIAFMALPSGWHDRPPSAKLVSAVGRLVGVTVLTVAATVLIAVACGLGIDWIRAFGVPGRNPTVAPASMAGQLLTMAGLPGASVMPLVTVAIGFVVLVLLLVRVAPREPWRYAVLALVVVALAGPALYAWYLIPASIVVGLLAGGRLVSWVVGLGLGLTGGLFVATHYWFPIIVTESITIAMCVLAGLALARWWRPV
ncbi:polyprenol phosphomannose-dependent alpha 1,6 mannosyltransferase MptB [Microlunatus sp. Y2014]|uniref:polyprenol phosphomannose-dependent alpha 1,6 mannosyltransferase MptB n=1 Tax=Microlunatus sp. Y2014 TaxID=3418488 RepID=UPI003DA73006